MLNRCNKGYPCNEEEYLDMRSIDRVQLDVMETLKGCKLEPNEVMNIMLSIALSIAKDVTDEPVKALHDVIEDLEFYDDERNE